MLKMMGAALLVGASSLLGVNMHRRLSERIHLLQTLQNAFGILRTEISFLQTPLPEAAEKCAHLSGNAVFEALQAKLAAGQTPTQAMQAAITENGEVLSKADAEVLLYAASVLGNSDINEQEKHLSSVAARLEVQHKQAKGYMQTVGRLYLPAGLLGGVLVVLLLI